MSSCKITFMLNFFSCAISLLLLKRSMLRSNLSVMPLVKKILIAGVVLLVFEFLRPGSFNSRSFAGINSHLTARPTRVTSGDATPAVLQSRAKGDGGSVVGSDGDTACPGLFAAASGRGQVLLRHLDVPVCLSQILTPKVSRYISKSVLIL